MKAFLAIGAVILAGLGGYFLGQSKAPTPVNDADMIADLLPEDLLAMIRDEEDRKTFLSVWEQIAPQIGGLSASVNTVQQFQLPDGVPVSPFILTKPEEGVNWPDPSSLLGGDALAEAKAGWVVMNVWASWCAPCVAELPDVQNAANELADADITILTINADVKGKDSVDLARQILGQRSASDLPFIMAEDKESIDAFIGQVFPDPTTRSFPYTVIYAPGGVPFATFTGGKVSDEAIWAGKNGLAFFRGLAALQVD